MFFNQVHVVVKDLIHAVLVEIEDLPNYLLLTRLLTKFWHLVIRYVYGKNHLHFCRHHAFILFIP